MSRVALALAVLALLDVVPRCGKSNRPMPIVVGEACANQAGCPSLLKCYAFDPQRPAPYESQVCGVACQTDADCVNWGSYLSCLGPAREEGTHGAPQRICAKK